MKEPRAREAMNRCGNDSNRDAPEGTQHTLRMTQSKRCGRTSVLKPLKRIVGELRKPRGNKVFQVVTPADSAFWDFLRHLAAR